MKNLLLPFLALICISTAWSQNTFRAILKDEETHLPLAGANAVLEGTAIGSSTDHTGLVEIQNIPDGEFTIIFSYIGYEEKSEKFNFPQPSDRTTEIYLPVEVEETEQVIVTATRSSRTIADIPTRVEAIAGEELEEKGNMKPGEIRMVLNESTGIQTQQTSATSYNSSIRIQGLDGKYTQILKDGFPLFSGFSGGLSLLQIVPLDLKQVEVIKGASSTLYGGGAIAGLVNLVSRTPEEGRQLNFLLNATTAGGFDGSGFYAERFGLTGTTIFVSYNMGSAYDPAGIGLTAIPEFRRYTVNPKLFFYINDQATINIGFNSTIEERTGGDIKYIEGQADSLHSYFELNRTTRFSTQAGLDFQISKEAKISLKNSASYYDRNIKIPGFSFAGKQFATFSEASFTKSSPKLEWIAGFNLWTEQFVQVQPDTPPVVDYRHLTIGGFVQNTWNATPKLSLETGLRLDHQNEYGSFVLPRIAMLIKIKPELTFRLGSGLGYKTPTVFTEDAERLQFRNILPIDANKTKAEESIGFNFDTNYRTLLSARITMSLNTLLYYTKISDPLILTPAAIGFYEFSQPGGYIDTKGLETNIKLTYEHYKLFVGYTLADVHQHFGGETTITPLVARNRLNNVLIYEKPEQIKLGLEAYYFSPQKLSDGRTGQAYWIFGFMAEKIWDEYSIFLNFENFLDVRQTRFETIYSGSQQNPVFNDIYAPLDGFIINGGVKLRF